MKHGSDRALGFCCSRKHAADMAREFSKRGIPSAAVFSGPGEESEYCLDRQTAVRRLSEGKIRVIFSVDMFNDVRISTLIQSNGKSTRKIAA